MCMCAAVGCGGDLDLFPGTAAAPVVLAQCDGPLPEDERRFHVDTATIEDDMLKIAGDHGGGCREHAFAACWPGVFSESSPVQVALDLHHDDGGDRCDALLFRDVYVDLSAVRDAYRDAYGGESGSILLRIDDTDVDVQYDF